MKMHTHAALALLVFSSPLFAQQPPAIRPLGPVIATASEPLTVVGHLRALPGGRLLLNDPFGRRVVLMDSTLKVVKVVADSTSGTASAYGPRPGGLIAYRGDSTLFVDPASLSMLVLDGEGKVARVMSVPRPQEAGSLTSISFGAPALDAEGRLVYRAFPTRIMRSAAVAAVAGERGRAAMPEMPDTAAIVRLDLATRAIDTVAFIRIPRVASSMTRGEDGSLTMSQVINPLPMVDEWAVTSDGRLAIVRGRDYRVERIGGDGKVVASSKLPFEWQRLSDEDKVALIDSVKAQRERMATQAGAAAGGPPTVVFGGAPGGEAPAPGAVMNITMRTNAGGEERTVTSNNVRANITYVAPSELPDYKPPFFAGAVRADADGNLWVRTIPTRAIAGGPVYDVIDATGTLVERVQVPAGREIRGFGPGGIVYLVSRDGNRTVLEAARAK